MTSWKLFDFEEKCEFYLVEDCVIVCLISQCLILQKGGITFKT